MSTTTRCDLQLIVASGPEDAQRALIGIQLALTTALMGDTVSVWLTGNGAVWACETEAAQDTSPLGGQIRETLERIAELGGEVGVCPSCRDAHCGPDESGEALPTGLAAIAARLSKTPTMVF